MLENYLNLNWKIIPLHANTKQPIFKDWNIKWNKEITETIFSQYLDCNIGLLLGNVIDIEADTEESNKLINDLLKDYNHPIYKSDKSCHHLFKNPYKHLTRFVKNHIEFRAYNHHSVLPPSIHPNGSIYTWVTSYETIPEMPQSLKNLFSSLGGDIVINKIKEKHQTFKHDYLRCNSCHKKFLLHKARLEIELLAFSSKNIQWQCNDCRERWMFDFIKQFKTNYKNKKSKDSKKTIWLEKYEQERIHERRQLDKNVMVNNLNADILKVRESLLQQYCPAKRELSNILLYLQHNFDKAFKTHYQRAFLTNSVPGGYFFIDFMLRSLRLCLIIDNEKNRNNWEKFYEPILIKNKFKLVSYSYDQVLNEPKKILADIILQASEIENYAGVRIRNLFKNKSLSKIIEGYKSKSNFCR
jgi:hypothetical protein